MNDLNKSLLNTIDKIEHVEFVSEMKVLSEMETYYNKCVKLIGYADENSAVVEDLSLFGESYIITEGSIKDKMKSAGQKVGKALNTAVDKADQWSKSPTSGGRIKKIVFGLAKGITAIIVKIIKLFKMLVKVVSKLLNHDVDATIKSYDEILDDIINRFKAGKGATFESYVEDSNEQIVQEVAVELLAAPILKYVTKQGMKSVVDKATNNGELIPTFAKKEKEQLAIRIRKIDRMSKEQKMKLIARSNKIIDVYCSKANNASEEVVQAICDSIVKQLKRSHPNESAEEMFERLDKFMYNLDKTLITAMKGLASGAKSIANVASDVGKAVGISGDTVAKGLAVVGKTSIKMLKYTKELANSEAIGNETAKALIEIVGKKDLIARSAKMVKGMITGTDKKLKSIEKTDKETEYTEKMLYKHDISVNYWHQDYNILTDIQKASDEIDAFLTKKLKVLTHTGKKKLDEQRSMTQDKQELLDWNAEYKQNALDNNNEYYATRLKEIDELEKNGTDPKYIQNLRQYYRDSKEDRDAVQAATYDEARERIESIHPEWIKINEDDLDPAYLDAYNKLDSISDELSKLLVGVFDKDERDVYKGMSNTEAVITLASKMKEYNAAYIKYIGITAKTVNKNIIQLDSIQDSLAELGTLVQKFGDAVLKQDEANRTDLRAETGTDKRTVEYECISALDKFIGRISKAAGFCLTKCVTNPTSCKKLMDKTVADALRSSVASVENAMIQHDIDERNNVKGDEE